MKEQTKDKSQEQKASQAEEVEKGEQAAASGRQVGGDSANIPENQAAIVQQANQNQGEEEEKKVASDEVSGNA